MLGACEGCALLGDDGLCFAEEPKDCSRGLIGEDFFDDLEVDLEEDELEKLEEEDAAQEETE